MLRLTYFSITAGITIYCSSAVLYLLIFLPYLACFSFKSNPIFRLVFVGGAMSCRIASKTILNWPSYFFSRLSRRRASDLLDETISLSLTKARIMPILTSTARSLFRIPESIATPCSVKARTCFENLRSEDITICDILIISSLLRKNIKSAGNLLIFL